MPRLRQAGTRDWRVVLADSDPAEATSLVHVLRMQGFAVDVVDDGKELLAAVEHVPPEAVVFDLAVSNRIDGHAVLVRLVELGVPVVVYSDRAAETDRIVGLELGADDYQSKHCSPDELAARLRAVMRRRHQQRAPSRLAYHGLVIDLAAREVFLDGREISLRPLEFELLAFLARQPGQAFSREQLLQHVWQSQAEWQDPATVTEHIRRLRRALEGDHSRPGWLVTVTGVGYRFDP